MQFHRLLVLLAALVSIKAQTDPFVPGKSSGIVWGKVDGGHDVTPAH